uniref:NADH-ubiquinone oxidoreductase chain 1 n=1 Tax=Ruizia karukerae TaxID=2201929 RepID=A0A343YNA4_9BILA|nr:NADH dehydrogenase subunit 1 [Ruizia karukerae]
MLLSFLIIFFVVQGVAFVTLYERHLLGGSQQRIGPNKVSFLGLVQAIFDGVKLLKKEQISPFRASDIYFLFAPAVAFVVMFLEWFVLPYIFGFLTFGFSIMFFLVLIGFMVYSFLVSGLISKSKYGYVGGLRASSQSVSYEIAFTLYLLSIVIHLQMFSFLNSNMLNLFVLQLPFLMMVLAELNRAPFDFTEGESELVSGYNVEFSSVPFVLLFLSEYGSLLFFSTLFSFMFFDMSLLVIYIMFSILVFIRSSYPRFRYDMMMNLFWFKLLPLSLIYLWYFFVLIH